MGNLSLVINIYFLCISIIDSFLISYIFRNYINENIRHYSILRVLGIRKNNLYLLIVIEYLSISLLVVLVGLVIGNIAQFIIINLLGYGEIFNIYSIDLKSNLVMVGYFFAMVFISLGINLVKVSRKNLKTLLDSAIANFNQNKYLGLVGIIGISFVIYSFYLLQNFSVMNMFISVFCMFIGIFLILSFNGPNFILLFKRYNKKYFEQMIAINNYYQRFVQNKRILFITFILNFLIIFFIGSIVVSSTSQSENMYDNQYPFSYVILSNQIMDQEPAAANTSVVSMVEVKEGDIKYYCISLENYNLLTASNEKLSQDELLFVSQRIEEDSTNHPYNEKSILLKGVETNNNVKFTIKEDKYQILFGRQLSDELTNILVLNNQTFNSMLTQNESTVGVMLIKENDSAVLNKIKTEDMVIYDKTVLITLCKGEDVFVFLTFLIIGSISILCSWFILFIKIMSEYNHLIEKYKFLSIIGMNEAQRKKSIVSEFKLIFVLPLYISTPTGIMYFLITYFQSSSVYQLKEIFTFLGYLTILILIQFLFYISVKKNFLVKLNKDVVLNNEGEGTYFENI